MTRPWGSTGIGWILALIVLLLVIMAFVFSAAMPSWFVLAMIGLLALAMLV